MVLGNGLTGEPFVGAGRFNDLIADNFLLSNQPEAKRAVPPPSEAPGQELADGGVFAGGADHFEVFA